MEYELFVLKDAKPIVFSYLERPFPLMDTGVLLYDAYKLNLMLSDGLAAILNDRNDIYNTFSGDLLFFRPEEVHHGRILRQGTHKYIEILIPTEYFPKFEGFQLLFNDSGENRTNLLSPPPQERMALLSLAEQMIHRLGQASLDRDLFFLSRLLELLEICGKLYFGRDKGGNPNVPASLQRAIDFIRREYSRDLQVGHVAASMNCSASYLSRIFKKHLGKSPYAYLTEYRLFMAEKLLRGGNNITEIAVTCGFHDSSVFIKCFKKAFGTTPLKYKKALSSGQ